MENLTEFPADLLADVSAERSVRVRQLHGGKDFASRMAALGLIEGAEIKVIQNYKHGPLIAMVCGSRVSLGRGEAAKVLVENLGDEQ